MDLLPSVSSVGPLAGVTDAAARDRSSRASHSRTPSPILRFAQRDEPLGLEDTLFPVVQEARLSVLDTAAEQVAYVPPRKASRLRRSWISLKPGIIVRLIVTQKES